MEDLFKFFGASVLITALITFLGKELIKRGFDAALESFKNKLQLLKIEHQVKFSKLHEERANILKTMYAELYQLEQDLIYYTSIFQGPEWLDDNTRFEKASTKLSECQDLFEKNRFYFIALFCEELETALKTAKNVIKQMEQARFQGRMERDVGNSFSPKDGQHATMLWVKQEEASRITIRKQRIQLAETFRKIIGVENVNN